MVAGWQGKYEDPLSLNVPVNVSEFREPGKCQVVASTPHPDLIGRGKPRPHPGIINPVWATGPKALTPSPHKIRNLGKICISSVFSLEAFFAPYH
jgi:hypothetical protein